MQIRAKTKAINVSPNTPKSVPEVDAPSPKDAPTAPKAGMSSSQKDPKKVAEQLKDPKIKDQAMDAAKKLKEKVTVSSSGQWKLHKASPVPNAP